MNNLPAIARPHWSRSHATAHARVLPVVGLVVTKRTKSASATPSGGNSWMVSVDYFYQTRGTGRTRMLEAPKKGHSITVKIPSTYSRGSCTPPSCPHAEYPLNRKFPFTGSTDRALLNQSAVWPKAYIKLVSKDKFLGLMRKFLKGKCKQQCS